MLFLISPSRKWNGFGKLSWPRTFFERQGNLEKGVEIRVAILVGSTKVIMEKCSAHESLDPILTAKEVNNEIIF
jgi:hypothetical protein